MQVIRGARVKPRSHCMISFASAWADIESIRSMRAATGTIWPWILTVSAPSTSCRPRVPAAW